MSVFVDSSLETHVFGCDDCPYWRGIAFSKEEAEERAIVHEETLHGTHRRRAARDIRLARQARRAEELQPTP